MISYQKLRNDAKHNETQTKKDKDFTNYIPKTSDSYGLQKIHKS